MIWGSGFKVLMRKQRISFVRTFAMNWVATGYQLLVRWKVVVGRIIVHQPQGHESVFHVCSGWKVSIGQLQTRYGINIRRWVWSDYSSDKENMEEVLAWAVQRIADFSIFFSEGSHIWVLRVVRSQLDSQLRVQCNECHFISSTVHGQFGGCETLLPSFSR